MSVRTPFLKRQISPNIINTISISASISGLFFAFASLVGIPMGCGLASLGMFFAIMGLLGQAAWWSDRYGTWTMIGPMLLIGFSILGIALLFIKTASPVCFN